MSVEIKLTMYEIMMAANVGVMRQVESLKHNMQQRHGADSETDWQKHIESALTECAMAKYTNVFWCKRARSKPDVGEDEVRASQRPNSCHLRKPALPKHPLTRPKWPWQQCLRYAALDVRLGIVVWLTRFACPSALALLGCYQL